MQTRMVPLLLVAALAWGSRLVPLHGTSALTRGESLGSSLSSAILALYAHKLDTYGQVPGALALWHNISESLTPACTKWAPVTSDEIEGAASARNLNSTVMRLLAVEYELLMALGDEALADKCTGIATERSPDGIIAGQNNDEDPGGWLEGALDVVLRMPASEDTPAALLYTHPGWPAYMGVNSAGLVVLWQYIDDGSRNLESGLPTCVLIRELLAQHSLQAAAELLRTVPVAVPNNFILADTSSVVDVEVSPKHFSMVRLSSGDLVHTNHVIFDQTMQDNDIGLNQSKSSTARFHAAREMVRSARGRMDVQALETMLQTAPVFRNGTQHTDNHTLASIVFVPEKLSMYIRFKSDPYMSYSEYNLRP